MWRRTLSFHLRKLSSPPLPRPSTTLFPRHLSTSSDNVVSKKRVEDVMPIATGHEREELEAELEGRIESLFVIATFLFKLFEVNDGLITIIQLPFGTKEAPAIIKSYYDRRIVGCPGGEGEDEHDVVWFWLEKGKSHECPVCSQYFELEVVGPGGPPDGHDDDDSDHHH
ncbi:hypothetical protein Leryth_003079 [Lithospermum erythrorhizon]|nr:hypothetical protein Leryth_003079 [Lithospermum erythrorhizon]